MLHCPLLAVLATPALALMCFAMPPARAQSAAHIDPLLGVDGGGNVIIGPALPYGMAKPGPDMAPSTSNAGWNADGEILGFSQTHVSGTGGTAKYGNVLILPTTGPNRPTDAASPRSHEHASAGYYSVGLARYKIQAEITASRRTAVYRFTYPAAQKANLLFDTGHILVSRHEGGQIVTSSHAEILSPTEIAGFSSAIRGWNAQDTPYTVFFYAASDTPAVASGTWQQERVDAGSKTETYTMPQPLSTRPKSAPSSRTALISPSPPARSRPSPSRLASPSSPSPKPGRTPSPRSRASTSTAPATLPLPHGIRHSRPFRSPGRVMPSSPSFPPPSTTPFLCPSTGPERTPSGTPLLLTTMTSTPSGTLSEVPTL